MTRRYDTITFLSDYGTSDEFVGVVHSVIRTLAPDVAVIDLNHNVAPFDVRAGSLALARAAAYMAPGVVLAVVDPGVGTQRKKIAVEVGDGDSVLVGPDNGLLAPAVAMVGGATRAVELTNSDYQLPERASTFDGRDVFAPVAAHLCNGVPFDELGSALGPARLQPGLIPVARPEGNELVAEVLWVDRFGNAQLNVGPEDVAGWDDRCHVRVGSDGTVRSATRVTTFAELASGQLGLVVDSVGLLALVLDRRSAASEMGAGMGTEVTLTRLEDDEQGGTQSTPVPLGRSNGQDPAR